MPRSIICVSVGQFGNQLIPAFYSDIVTSVIIPKTPKCENSLDISSFFRVSKGSPTKLIPRCVLIDMEQKVIDKTCKFRLSYPQCSSRTSNVLSFDPRSSAYGYGGSGNSWAFGYTHHGKKIWECVEKKLQQEISLCEEGVEGIIVFNSLAGGTGSGVGTYICEHIKSLLRRTTLLCVTVWPFSHGEVTIQQYNATMTLSHLLDVVDGIIAFSNDGMKQICRKEGIPETFLEINRKITNILGSLLSPSFHTLSSSSPFYDLVSTTFSNPLLKISHAFALPQHHFDHRGTAPENWSSLLSTHMRMALSGSDVDEGMRSLDKFKAYSMFSVFRGKGAKE
ncbi:putative multi-domain containing protein, partial [Aduncisulcus paluster]